MQCPSLPLVQDYGFSYGQEVGDAYVGFGLQRVAVFRVRQMVDVEREFASLSLRLVEAWGDEPFGVLGYAVLVEAAIPPSPSAEVMFLSGFTADSSWKPWPMRSGSRSLPRLAVQGDVEIVPPT